MENVRLLLKSFGSVSSEVGRTTEAKQREFQENTQDDGQVMLTLVILD